jgi:hypothetical protein
VLHLSIDPSETLPASVTAFITLSTLADVRHARPSLFLLATLLVASLLAARALAGELVWGVRLKLSAGDLASGHAAVEAYRKKSGVDAEYLDAVGWRARGAQMLSRLDLAAGWVAELRREIPAEKPDLLIPLGAAIEVEGKLRLARDGRGAAVAFLEGELARAKDVAVRRALKDKCAMIPMNEQAFEWGVKAASEVLVP